MIFLHKQEEESARRGLGDKPVGQVYFMPGASDAYVAAFRCGRAAGAGRSAGVLHGADVLQMPAYCMVPVYCRRDACLGCPD